MESNNPATFDRTLTDSQILQHCRWEAFRGSGPGGQKRNKTSSAVRVVHQPTGLSATASESRSQSENRHRAFQRLRLTLVLDIRQSLDPQSWQPPAWFNDLLTAGRLDLSRRHPQFLPTVGLLLDVLAATAGKVSDAARLLNLSTANFVDWSQREPKLWAKIQQIRTGAGLKPLQANS